MKIVLTAFVAAALALPAVAHADDDGDDMSGHYSKTFVACTERDANDGAMVDCAIAEGKRWDSQLNAAYRKLMASLPAARSAKLREEERAWIAATKAKCDKARADMDGTPVQQDIEAASCVMDETIKQTLHLRAYR
jgi:uncharacterized protein YecT (DUF1311 family)